MEQFPEDYAQILDKINEVSRDVDGNQRRMITSTELNEVVDFILDLALEGESEVQQ